MLVFIYEFVTGGGLLCHGGPGWQSSLATEGAAMAKALAADFAALPDTQVCRLQDFRGKMPRKLVGDIVTVTTAKEHDAEFDRLAVGADWTVVIAPEMVGQLSACCRRVQQAGGRLLGPSPEITDLAGDKQATAEHLAAAGIPVPDGMTVPSSAESPADCSFPAVVKPLDGAGSLGVRLVASRDQLGRIVRNTGEPLRLESFCPGTPVSVACLCGPGVCLPLAPCRQLLSTDGQFRYQGGALPLTVDEADRARRLAARAVRSLTAPLGYLGVDMVLGDDTQGRDDVVIEINPRLTTSYVGLRAATSDNLAAAMLEVASGRAPALSFRRQPLRFDLDGNVRTGLPRVFSASTNRIESTT